MYNIDVLKVALFFCISVFSSSNCFEFQGKLGSFHSSFEKYKYTLKLCMLFFIHSKLKINRGECTYGRQDQIFILFFILEYRNSYPSKVITIWGQNYASKKIGAKEPELETLCLNSPYDVIIIGYVTRFFDTINSQSKYRLFWYLST